MQPIEINAGAWYLRCLRADERVDDRPVLLTAAADPDTMWYAPLMVLVDLRAATDYVQRRALQWANDSWYSWAVCDPTTGEMLAEVGLRNIEPTQRTAELACWTAPKQRGRGIMAAAVGTVLRLAFQRRRWAVSGCTAWATCTSRATRHRPDWRRGVGWRPRGACVTRCSSTAPAGT